MGERGADTPDEGTLVYHNRRMAVRGRALTLILWVVSRQKRINDTAPTAGQVWLSWKGDGPQSIAGDLKTPL